MINTSKPTTSYTNQDKVNIGETWASITTTWATETRTWADMASLIDNVTRVFGGLIWAYNVFPWQLSTPWIDSGSISNIAKP